MRKTFNNILANKCTTRPAQHYRLHASRHAVALIDALLDQDEGEYQLAQ